MFGFGDTSLIPPVFCLRFADINFEGVGFLPAAIFEARIVRMNHYSDYGVFADGVAQTRLDTRNTVTSKQIYIVI